MTSRINSDYALPAVSGEDLPPSSPSWQGRFARCLKKFWWICILTLIAGSGAGALLVSHMKPFYVSNSSMWETSKIRLPDQSLYSDDVEDVLGTQIQLLQSGKLRRLALEGMASQSNGLAAFPDLDYAPPIAIQVNVVPKSTILEIQASGSDPAFTRSYLDALMQALLDYDRDVHQRISGITLSSLSDQIQTKEQELKVEQDALAAFQQTNNIAIIQEQASAARNYLEGIQSQLSNLQLESKLLETAIQENEQATNGGSNVSIPLDVIIGPASMTANGSTDKPQHAAVASSDSDLDLMKMERAELAKTLSTQSLQISDLDQQIAHAEEAKVVNRRRTIDELLARQKANQVKIAYVQNSEKEWEARVVDAETRLAQAEQLRLNMERTQGAYDRLTLLSQNLGISRSIDQESLAILEPASNPVRSYRAEKSKLGLAAIGGLFAGIGIIFLINLRDDRMTSISEVDSLLPNCVVATLPRVDQLTKRDALLDLNDSRHAYTESYRSLGSALRFLEAGDNKPKVLLVTSATPNEGKSTVAVNLAHTLAAGGLKVLLVDADLRKGHLHKLTGLSNEKGLHELLAGECKEEEVIQRNSLPNLAVISRGKCNGRSDLLLHSHFKGYLNRWRQEFDYVLIDSSPLFATADAGYLAPIVDGTLFLVRSHHSSARVTHEALRLLAQRNAKILGMVFNMADLSAHSRYYYKYPEYYPPEKPLTDQSS